jgi:site-specific DNA recombinase
MGVHAGGRRFEVSIGETRGPGIMRVVGYVRVSTDEQASDGVSLAAQEAKVRAYCGLYELELVELVRDPGASAKTLDRPGLARALGLLDRGEAAGIVVAKLDRLTRSVADLAELLDRYFGDRPGKQLFSVGDSIDTRTAAGRLVLNVLMSVAQWELETIVERTNAALAHKKSQGECVGQVPFGRDRDPDGPSNKKGLPVRLRENPAEAAVIEQIRSLRAEGLSPRKIAARLNAGGVPTKAGRGPWIHTSVAKILKRIS